LRNQASAPATENSGQYKQRMIGEWFGGLDKGLVSGDRRAYGKRDDEPKIHKWFHDPEIELKYLSQQD
jgi:hypothetical protein